MINTSQAKSFTVVQSFATAVTVMSTDSHTEKELGLTSTKNESGSVAKHNQNINHIESIDDIIL